MEIKIEKKESQSSFEFGKAGQRFKLYFWTIEELQEKVKQILKFREDNDWSDLLMEEKK